MSNAKLLRKIANYIVRRLRQIAPRDTGNLADNAIRSIKISKNKIEISVDGAPPDIGIAPYMPYTNEPWISPKWNGKKNLNEHWWNDAIVLILQEVAQIYGGTLTNDAKA